MENENKNESNVETVNEESNEVSEKPKRGRPKKAEFASPAQIEEMYQKLLAEMEPRPEADLCSEQDLNDHNKKLIRQIQIILSEDMRMMSAKNTVRIATPNGIQKFEITGLTKDQREHLREVLKILITSVKLFSDSGESPSSDKLKDITKQLYKGIPGLQQK